ncbi:MAG TPA: hypothetical protein DHU86_07900, partial [Polaribacter sp.]|nr:hypothetical protein [Polaribacter sp.]
PSISSNFQFRNLDNSTITDISAAVELRETNASGTLVAINAILSDDNSTITIVPSELLNTTSTYWFGVIDSAIEYKESDIPVTGLFSTFTTTADAATLVSYNDFEGTSLMSVSESMGGTPGAYDIVTDPIGGANMVQQWVKGNTWGGWERIHFELNAAFDASKDDIFSFRVYSPVRTNFMLKLADAKEDGDQNAVFEQYGDILIANQWQTVYVDTSELADGLSLNHVFVFLGPGQANITGTFYVDDLKGPQLQGTASVKYFDKNSFQFFPNPANDKIYFSNLEGEKVIRIFDINSKQVLKKTIDANDLSIKNLKPGFYFLEINGQYKKLIKE